VVKLVEGLGIVDGGHQDMDLVPALEQTLGQSLGVTLSPAYRR
jgi:hypothetical protein